MNPREEIEAAIAELERDPDDSDACRCDACEKSDAVAAHLRGVQERHEPVHGLCRTCSMPSGVPGLFDKSCPDIEAAASFAAAYLGRDKEEGA